MNDPISLSVRDPGPDSLERDIQARASVAPRVTPADIEAEITHSYYINAGEAQRAKWPDPSAMDECHPSLDLLTICVLVLRNGAKVVGVNYGAIDPQNHSADTGRKEAFKDAENKVWELLGFRLRDKLHAQTRCQGERCMATTQNGLHHSRECIAEAGRNQGWTPTAEELASAGPSAPLAAS